MTKIGEHDISEFLKHMAPADILSKFEGVPTWGDVLRWERMKKIADGEAITRTEWHEHYYEGEGVPSQIVAWLQQYDDSWTVNADTEASGREWYVCKAQEVFLTEEEIEAAKRYIAEHPEPERKNIKFVTVGLGINVEDA